MAKKRRPGRARERKPSSPSASVGPKHGEKRGREGKSSGASIREWAKSLAIAVVLFFFIRTFILQTFVIISGSMEDGLLVGDLLLVNRTAVGSRVPGTSLRIPGYSDPERGEVFVFDPHHEEDMKLVKRLIGLPGDTLEMMEKQLFVNGDPLAEPYVKHTVGGRAPHDTTMNWQAAHLVSGADVAAYRPTRDDWGPIVVPDGHYFMLGDNRDESLDSRYWGPLETWRIEGRAVLIYFSYNRGSLRPFPALFEMRLGRIGNLIR